MYSHSPYISIVHSPPSQSIRIVFRFLFTIPFVILGADGIRSVPVINTKRFAVGTDGFRFASTPTHLVSELLTVVAAIGCGVSSGLTLVIFFPRSIESEIAAREGRVTPSQHYSIYSDSDSVISRFEIPDTPAYPEVSAPKFSLDNELPALSPNRKRGTDVEIGRIASTDTNNSRLSLNPMVHNFTSPIGELRWPRLRRTVLTEV